MAITPIYPPITNYIYLYHTNTFIFLPGYPDNMTDSSSATFNSNQPLGRSAPIFSYSHSGPRSVNFQFELHREMLDQFNGYTPGQSVDTVDKLIREIQAAVLPNYAASEKMVDPPLVACRVGADMYIKGVVNGSVSVGYSGPILYNDKYAVVTLNFPITEVDPYDAQVVQRIGSYRYSGDIVLNTNMDQNVYSAAGSNIRGSGGRHIPLESADRYGLVN